MAAILITGAGGSIGSELVLQLASMSLNKKLILNDISEYNLFMIGQKLLERGFEDYDLVLGCCGDTNVLKEIFSRKIAVIYHAAAYKHVNLSQKNPQIYFRNNVLGMYNILSFVDTNDVSFTLVSTDKAVEPINPMGMSKRLCELVLMSQIAPVSNKKTVRFGNVLNSSGSVIPIFKDQIERGGPILVTHPDAKRYFMSIGQAVSLVLSTDTLSSGTYILDMGNSVKILDLAYNLAAQNNLRIVDDPQSSEEIGIEYIGLREGEKLEEKLSFGRVTQTEKIGVLRVHEEVSDNKNFLMEILAFIKDGKNLPINEIDWTKGGWRN